MLAYWSCSFLLTSAYAQVAWSFKGESVSCQKTETFTSDGAAPTAPTSSGPASSRPAQASAQDPAQMLQSAEQYLEKHKIRTKVEAAVNELLKAMPENAVEALAGSCTLTPRRNVPFVGWFHHKNTLKDPLFPQHTQAIPLSPRKSPPPTNVCTYTHTCKPTRTRPPCMISVGIHTQRP